MNTRRYLPWCVAACLMWPLDAQQLPSTLERPSLPLGLRSYAAPVVAPIRLTNSLRIQSLMRGGNLYLTVQDALALAIENNLNLELDRYEPIQAQFALERAKAGGPLRGVPNSNQQVSSIDSGLGVSGSQLAAGLLGGNGGGLSGGGGGATIQQVGQVTPNLDPVLQSSASFSHLTSPQSNLLLAETPVLIRTVRNYSNVATEGLLTGGIVRFYDYEQYLRENSPSDNLNPAVGPYMAIFLQHSLLQGFGRRLNDRTIRIGQINIAASRELFRSQLLDLSANVLNLYWDLVSARDELQVRRQALEITQKFYNDTQYEISVGAIARFQLTRAQAEVATRRQDVIISQDNVQQREIALKQVLSHTEDPVLDAAPIIPLDRIEVPATDDLSPLRQLVATAMSKRPDVAVSRFRDQTDQINLLGTTNPLLPNLQVYAYTLDRGVAGSPQASAGGAPAYFTGGYGTALGQVFRRNFPNNTAGLSFAVSVGNHQAQGDYGIDQLQFRQSELRGQKDANQIAVDVANQVNALRQARARYSVAQSTHILQQQLLEADQKRASGTELFDTLMNDQRGLIAAELSENDALAAYARARDSLDQVLGQTLESYNISLDEGLAGRVDRQSRLPDVLPK
ncbi:MAG TPA: TolC family protein [Bryobacteraceae bacterium]|nr:TolC family protein [Bryobacteraceae bacterium]